MLVRHVVALGVEEGHEALVPLGVTLVVEEDEEYALGAPFLLFLVMRGFFLDLPTKGFLLFSHLAVALRNDSSGLAECALCFECLYLMVVMGWKALVGFLPPSNPLALMDMGQLLNGHKMLSYL